MDSFSKEIQISEKLIEVGDDAWQIRNLTGISRREEKIQINEPRPSFSEAEPKGSWHPKRLVWFFLAGLLISIFSQNGLPIIAGLGIGLWSFFDGNSDAKKAWSESKSDYEKRLLAWNKLKNNPPIVYSLAIETNSGSRPVFYSFDKDGVGNIVQAVKNAMEKPGSIQATYNINTLGETNITQIGSDIFQQTISEMKA